MPDYDKKLEDLLDHHLISNEKLVKRKKLGGVGYLVNGHMCLGIYNDQLVARIGSKLAQELNQKEGISLYAPGNARLEDIVLVDPVIYLHSKALQKFISQAISYTSGLPPKEPE